jgi:hypothetical protein
MHRGMKLVLVSFGFRFWPRFRVEKIVVKTSLIMSSR